MSGSRELHSLHHVVKKRMKFCSIRVILGAFALALTAFYAGFMLGIHQCQQCLHGSTTVQNSIEQAKADILQAVSQQKVNEKVVVIQPQEAEESPKEETVRTPANNTIRHDESALFPASIRKLVAGMARVDRDLFATKFDVGVPLNPTTPGNKDVLILYNSENALPDQFDKYQEDVPHLNIKSATKHCHTMKVVLTEPSQQKQCLAIMGQWESYHVHRFARFPPKMDGPVDEMHPLKYVSRVPGENGKVIERSRSFDTKMWDKLLVEYLNNLDPVLKQLKPIAQQVAAKDNTVVVMVCNLGQSELLMNFACAARLRGLDLSQVLVFATDLETKTQAEGLGLAAFYDELNYESIPEQAAQTYADNTFSKMMLAKLYCVHMINALGYDLLFQDVDIVWYRNPVEYFTNDSNPYRDFDMYFQQDGSPSRRYAPYSPNTGFYFVRNNLKTQYFFHSLLMQGNLITGSGSHQSALNIVLQEHASWRGLRVKVLNVETEMFPGGFHFHRRKDFMKDMIAGKVKPYIFHMSWTTNKENKRMFFEQLGDWHVDDQCIGSTTSKILSDGRNNGSDLPSACCLAKPQVKCHYRDKPSRIPCKDRPSIDKDKPSWW